MKTSMKWSTLLGASAIALIGVAGCADKNNNGEPDSVATAPQIKTGMDKAANATANAVSATANAVKPVGKTVVKAVDNAANATANAAKSVAKAGKNLDDAATMTPKIKTALGAAASLKGSNINVDTTDKNVTLSGTAKNAAQKAAAGKIAAQNAHGYKIINNLKVG